MAKLQLRARYPLWRVSIYLGYGRAGEVRYIKLKEAARKLGLSTSALIARQIKIMIRDF